LNNRPPNRIFLIRFKYFYIKFACIKKIPGAGKRPGPEFRIKKKNKPEFLINR